MTFQKFAAIIAAHRPEITVGNHGTGKAGTQKVLIAFGSGKAYSYTGSYADILNRLNIKTVTASDVATVKDQLERAKASHGKVNLFSGKTTDNRAKIAELTSTLAAYQSDEYIRDWE